MEITLANAIASATNEHLYLNDEFADVYFIFNVNNKVLKVPANKEVLGDQSPVFNRMFFGELKETDNVQIVDASVDEFKQFLQYFYLKKVRLTVKNIAGVARLTDKYDIMGRIVHSADSLLDKLKLDDMCWAYQLALCINHDELSKYCENYISLKPKEIFASESFFCCDAYTLHHILELSLATVEANIFKATIQWAKYACGIAGLDPEQVINLKMLLCDCLKSIRFGSMTNEDFHECYRPFKGLFTQDELDDIMMILNGTDAQPKIFNPTPRHHAFNMSTKIDINRSFSLEAHSYNIQPQTVQVVHFTSNHSALLGGLELVAPFLMLISNEFAYPYIATDVVVTELSTKPKILYEFIADVESYEEDLLQSVVINFPRPVLIERQTKYEIRVKLILMENGSDWTMWNQANIVETSGLSIRFYRDLSLTYDNSTFGLIETLYFNRL